MINGEIIATKDAIGSNFYLQVFGLSRPAIGWDEVDD